MQHIVVKVIVAIALALSLAGSAGAVNWNSGPPPGSPTLAVNWHE